MKRFRVRNTAFQRTDVVKKSMIRTGRISHGTRVCRFGSVEPYDDGNVIMPKRSNLVS